MLILCNFRSSQEKTAKGLVSFYYLPIYPSKVGDELRNYEKNTHGELWWLNNLDSPWEIEIQPMKSSQKSSLGHSGTDGVKLYTLLFLLPKQNIDKNCFCCHWLGTVHCTVLELKPVSHWLLCWPHSHHSCLSSPLYGWSTNIFNGSSLILLWSNHHVFGGKTRHLC